jgi:hypothetical protein
MIVRRGSQLNEKSAPAMDMQAAGTAEAHPNPIPDIYQRSEK